MMSDVGEERGENDGTKNKNKQKQKIRQNQRRGGLYQNRRRMER